MSSVGRFVHTLWCDDIRQELGNKPSFMGVFTGGLLLPQLPSALSKLGVYSWVVTPLDRPIRSLQLQVVRDDGTIIVEIKPEAPTELNPDEVPSDATRRQIVVGVMLSPVEIPLDCKWFVVRVTADDEVLEGPKLRVKVDSIAFAQATGGEAVPITERGEVVDPVK